METITVNNSPYFASNIAEALKIFEEKFDYRPEIIEANLKTIISVEGFYNFPTVSQYIKNSEKFINQYFGFDIIINQKLEDGVFILIEPIILQASETEEEGIRCINYKFIDLKQKFKSDCELVSLPAEQIIKFNLKYINNLIEKKLGDQ